MNCVIESEKGSLVLKLVVSLFLFLMSKYTALLEQNFFPHDKIKTTFTDFEKYDTIKKCKL